MKTLTDKVAAVTGAGSGIGRSLALALARRGTHLALSDIDEIGLAETVTLVEGTGVKVTSSVVDVTDASAVEAWAQSVTDEHGQVNLIVNNAGVALIADVASSSIDDIAWLMSINYWGVVYGTKAFLPLLEASGDGHVVNISSVFGLISVPGQSAYNSAKFAVRGFTDALRMELDIAGSPVSATTVHPGGIRTNIVRNARSRGEAADPARFDKIARTTPGRAAEVIIDAVLKNRRRVLVGTDAKIVDFLSRLPAVVIHTLLVTTGKRQARQGRPAR
ncbi:MAG: SDR family NAD(P)-dependent oxidoreductase [Actinobacteria bacterium]|nr:SDR family NAD(P)-dependent oxidoreductase [Actinomycetota bacterium]MCB9390932.1 SDR family NAD(P)-dependent oxidoreductase [Acidimicrobiia bacterium]